MSRAAPQIVKGDMIAANGVAHTISRVLFPPPVFTKDMYANLTTPVEITADTPADMAIGGAAAPGLPSTTGTFAAAAAAIAGAAAPAANAPAPAPAAAGAAPNTTQAAPAPDPAITPAVPPPQK